MMIMDRKKPSYRIFADTDGGRKMTIPNQPPIAARLRIFIKAWLRRDGIVILLYALSTILMSYPLAFRLGTPWLALRDTDTYVKLWDNWWLQNLAFKEPSLFFTDVQFYPRGLDLSFHSISWTVAFLAWALTTVTDAITAYNLTILVALFSTAYAAYLLARPFVDYRAAAWLAGAIYSFAPYHVTHSGGHPDLVHLAPLPLAVLLLYRAITRPSILAALASALMIGLAAFTSLYIMVFALLTIGPVLIFLLADKRRWSQREVWHTVILFGLVSTFLLAIRLVPIFRDGSALTEAIDLKYTANQNQTDLLSYFLPSHLNPLFAPYTRAIALQFGHMGISWPAYLGFVPLSLTVVALTWKRHRKVIFLWLAIGLLFFFLSLGPALRFNGKLYENIVLPAKYLTWFPPIKAVGRPNFFVLGSLLPLALLAAFGFDRLLSRVKRYRKLQTVLILALPALLLVEYWTGDFRGVSSAVSPFYEQLAVEPGDFAIIELPMGRGPSKEYLYFQTIHQKPIVEGLSARTPKEAYEYIESNLLLLNWSRRKPLDCSLSPRRITSALDQLIDDNFRYVVVHRKNSQIPDQYADYFLIEPYYQDNNLTAFRLADLRNQPPCPDIYERVFDQPSPENPTSISWADEINLTGFDHPRIDRGSGILSITVYWQAFTEIEDAYVSYFHLVDSETGSLVAQADVIPRGWTYPTDWWMKGEVVEDTVQIPIDDVPPGPYELRIGWYDQETGLRLKPSSDQLRLLPDGSALLTVIKM